jgi:hypothetical protein
MRIAAPSSQRLAAEPLKRKSYYCCLSELHDFSSTFFNAMADVGSAVGIVSLILQVSKEVVWFIDSAKDAKTQVSQIAAWMGTLTNLLELLEDTVSKVSQSNAKDATQVGIIACSDALDKIKTRLASLSATKTSRLSQQLQHVRQRLLYPFKQADILFYKDLVESVQQNLMFAFSILQLLVLLSSHMIDFSGSVTKGNNNASILKVSEDK